ncbi:hypothetical protein GCM10010405_51240 [Streptomyces macrosporus]|uniref:Uncharacterized protein n=1 Tax=Streptomyces macrosporus TaxID=44032 RepID=A0ABN3KIR0_9ACTN
MDDLDSGPGERVVDAVDTAIQSGGGHGDGRRLRYRGAQANAAEPPRNVGRLYTVGSSGAVFFDADLADHSSMEKITVCDNKSDGRGIVATVTGTDPRGGGMAVILRNPSNNGSCTADYDNLFADGSTCTSRSVSTGATTRRTAGAPGAWRRSDRRLPGQGVPQVVSTVCGTPHPCRIQLMCPGLRGVELLESRRSRGCPELELDRCEHAECGVPTWSGVEDHEVLEDRVGQFRAGAPPAAVERLGLHPAPERFDHGVVVAVADRAHRGNQARGMGEEPA